jgi:hypothetical protein
LEVSGIGAPSVNITAHLTYDRQSYEADKITRAFMEANPSYPQAQRALNEIAQREREWQARNGEDGDG